MGKKKRMFPRKKSFFPRSFSCSHNKPCWWSHPNKMWKFSLPKCRLTCCPLKIPAGVFFFASSWRTFLLVCMFARLFWMHSVRCFVQESVFFKLSIMYLFKLIVKPVFVIIWRRALEVITEHLSYGWWGTEHWAVTGFFFFSYFFCSLMFEWVSPHSCISALVPQHSRIVTKIFHLRDVMECKT